MPSQPRFSAEFPGHTPALPMACWNSPDGVSVGITHPWALTHFRIIGDLSDVALAQGIESDNTDERAELLSLMVSDILPSNSDDMPLIASRRTGADGRHHGYIVGRRAGAANHPHVEISPDWIIAFGYHRADRHDQPCALPHLCSQFRFGNAA